MPVTLAGQMTQDFQARPNAARFLIVDEKLGRAAEFAQELGNEMAPAAVSIVACGRHALESLREERCDALLLDMPSLADLGAPEEAVTRLVKLAEGALALVFSDGSSISANLAVLRAGAHDCVPRHISASELSRRLAQLAGRHGKARVSRLFEMCEIGPLAGRDGLSRNDGEPPAILPMWRQEQRIIEEAIARCQGNVALAAAALELSPSTIYRKRQAWAEAEGKRGAA